MYSQTSFAFAEHYSTPVLVEEHVSHGAMLKELIAEFPTNNFYSSLMKIKKKNWPLTAKQLNCIEADYRKYISES